MARVLQTKDVLPMLAERGTPVSRGALAEMSDLLGLRARAVVAPWSPRRWGPLEVEYIAAAFELKREWSLDRPAIQALAADPAFAEALVGEFRAALEDFLGHAACAAAASRSWEAEAAVPSSTAPETDAA